MKPDGLLGKQQKRSSEYVAALYGLAEASIQLWNLSLKIHLEFSGRNSFHLLTMDFSLFLIAKSSCQAGQGPLPLQLGSPRTPPHPRYTRRLRLLSEQGRQQWDLVIIQRFCGIRHNTTFLMVQKPSFLVELQVYFFSYHKRQYIKS